MEKFSKERIKEIINDFGHELNTPLTSIKGFTQMLQKEEIISNTSTRNNYLKKIENNSDRLHSSIINMQILMTQYLAGKEELKNDERNNGC